MMDLHATTYCFEPLYFADRLQVMNPCGDIGVVTLWTPVQTVKDFLIRVEIDLNPTATRIAVLGNLYGDGLPQLIRNLLWNPQIRHLLILGQNLSGSADEISNLLIRGVELTERLGQVRFRIQGTNRYLDTIFDPTLLIGWVRPVVLNKLSSPATVIGVHKFFTTLPPLENTQRERKYVPLPDYRPVYFPSNPCAHTVVCCHPLDAWKEVVFRVLRFGIPTEIASHKRRIELQNLKVVVTEPIEDSEFNLQAVGYTLDDLHAYQKEMLCTVGQPEGINYSYSERLRRHWHRQIVSTQPLDMLAEAAAELATDPNSRSALLSLWDPAVDLGTGSSAPCLVMLYFRVFQGTLTMTATFRAHNVMSAWLPNLYGLIAVQTEVAYQAGGLPRGPITVISHSIAIDPDAPERLDLAHQIAAARYRLNGDAQNHITGKHMLREDPNGYFVFTIDTTTEEIIATHKAAGETLTHYRGRVAAEVERQITRDGAISDIAHALYVGRQLALLEVQVKKNK